MRLRSYKKFKKNLTLKNGVKAGMMLMLWVY
jgi:hypothetical protein